MVVVPVQYGATGQKLRIREGQGGRITDGEMAVARRCTEYGVEHGGTTELVLVLNKGAGLRSDLSKCEWVPWPDMA